MTDDRIAVLPAAPAYVGLAHPIDGPLKESGSLWTYDGFTCRLLTEGAILRPRSQPVAAPASKPSPEPASDAAADQPSA